MKLELSWSRSETVAYCLAVIVFGFLSMAACSGSEHSTQQDGGREVSSNVLISPSLPPLAIRVDPKFSYLGKHPIRIRDVAGGERHVFAEVQAGRASRLVVMQFEGFFDGVEDEYRYDLSSSPVVAGFPFRSNGYAFDMAESLRDNPSGEAAATNAFLTEQGLEAPRYWMMWRSLTVADPERRHELIIFYVEDAESDGLTVDDLYDGDQETSIWLDLMDRLKESASRSIELAPLDADGTPQRSWESIPS